MKQLVLDKFGDYLDTLYLYERDKCIELNNLILKEEFRGQGIGKKIMKFINNYADQVQKPVLLTPQSPDGYMSDDDLVKFYEKLGYQRNTGEIRDYSMPSHSHKRMPQ